MGAALFPTPPVACCSRPCPVHVLFLEYPPYRAHHSTAPFSLSPRAPPPSRIASSRLAEPIHMMATSSAALQLTRQLNQLRKHPVEGFSAGLVDDDNVFE